MNVSPICRMLLLIWGVFFLVLPGIGFGGDSNENIVRDSSRGTSYEYISETLRESNIERISTEKVILGGLEEMCHMEPLMHWDVKTNTCIKIYDGFLRGI